MKNFNLQPFCYRKQNICTSNHIFFTQNASIKKKIHIFAIKQGNAYRHMKCNNIINKQTKPFMP